MTTSDQWFVFYSGVRMEKKAALGLKEAGFGDVYVPQGTRTIRHAGKVMTVSRPVFPRYGFLQCGRRGFYDATRVQGVEAMLGTQGKPMSVRSSLVEDMRAAEARGLFDEAAAPDVIQWAPGQPVRVIAGAMQGWVGEVVRCNPKGRVELLLKTLKVVVDSAALVGADA